MAFFEVRIEILQNSVSDKPDYRKVHEAMSSISFTNTQLLGSIRQLPAMYRCYKSYTAIEQVRVDVERVLQPLGFRYRIQILEVVRELDFNLEPAPFFSNLFSLQELSQPSFLFLYC